MKDWVCVSSLQSSSGTSVLQSCTWGGLSGWKGVRSVTLHCVLSHPFACPVCSGCGQGLSLASQSRAWAPALPGHFYTNTSGPWALPSCQKLWLLLKIIVLSVTLESRGFVWTASLNAEGTERGGVFYTVVLRERRWASSAGRRSQPPCLSWTAGFLHANRYPDVFLKCVG